MMQYRNIWNEVDLQLFEKLTTDPLKREGKGMHGKLKTWKKVIRQIFMVKLFHTACIARQQQFKKLTLYTNKVKTTTHRNIWRGINTTMQKFSNVACWVIQLMMDILRCKQIFLKPSLGLLKVINKQDCIIRESERVEYTSSKLY